MARGGGKGFGDLESRSKVAAKGVNALGGAFEDLSKKGELSAQSIGQITSSLAAVNPALGAVAAAAGLAYRSFKMLEELELADDMIQFGAGAKVSVAEFEHFARTVNAGAGETGLLKEKLLALAEAQSFLQKHVAAVSAEAARQNALVAAGKVEQENAQGALDSFIASKKASAEARAQDVDEITAEVAALRKLKVESEQAAKAQKTLTEAIDRENHVFRVLHEGRVKQSGFASNAARDELENAEKGIGILQRKLALEKDMYSEEAKLLLTGIGQSQTRIDALEAEIEMMDAFGSMAHSAIGGVAAAAFNQYADAFDRVIDGHNAFNKSSGRTFQNAVSGVLRAVGQEAAVRAVMETAYGLAALTPVGQAAGLGNPGNHFAAAAMFATVATMAGVGSAALSVKSGAGSGSGKTGGSGDSGSGRSGPTINVTVVGQLDTQSVKNLAAQFRQEFYEGGG